MFYPYRLMYARRNYTEPDILAQEHAKSAHKFQLLQVSENDCRLRLPAIFTLGNWQDNRFRDLRAGRLKSDFLA